MWSWLEKLLSYFRGEDEQSEREYVRPAQVPHRQLQAKTKNIFPKEREADRTTYASREERERQFRFPVVPDDYQVKKRPEQGKGAESLRQARETERPARERDMLRQELPDKTAERITPVREETVRVPKVPKQPLQDQRRAERYEEPRRQEAQTNRPQPAAGEKRGYKPSEIVSPVYGKITPSTKETEHRIHTTAGIVYPRLEQEELLSQRKQWEQAQKEGHQGEQQQDTLPDESSVPEQDNGTLKTDDESDAVREATAVHTEHDVTAAYMEHEAAVTDEAPAAYTGHEAGAMHEAATAYTGHEAGEVHETAAVHIEHRSAVAQVAAAAHVTDEGEVADATKASAYSQVAELLPEPLQERNDAARSDDEAEAGWSEEQHNEVKVQADEQYDEVKVQADEQYDEVEVQADEQHVEDLSERHAGERSEKPQAPATLHEQDGPEPLPERHVAEPMEVLQTELGAKAEHPVWQQSEAERVAFATEQLDDPLEKSPAREAMQRDAEPDGRLYENPLVEQDPKPPVKPDAEQVEERDGSPTGAQDQTQAGTRYGTQETEAITSADKAMWSGAEDADTRPVPDQARQEVAVAALSASEVQAPPPYSLPQLDLLNPSPPPKADDDEHTQLQKLLLEETLANFNVSAQVVGIVKGPSVTRFELQPAPGVKVNKITSLVDDIKLNLAAKDIRIEAPIPGRNAIGIEVPNLSSQPVLIEKIIGSEKFQNHPSPLAVALGMDIGGEPIIADIKKMPHGLIAGATGSGKSVCINSIIVSLLFKATPEQVRLLLIDPKMVELAPYNHLPHLVTPVVTEAKQATAALKWAVEEMEKRYALFVDAGVRDIDRYNQTTDDQLPYIVIVIDELADLMMVSPQDVEDCIIRIAQKARACGIHLLLATQRPSVDVITGNIKANVPTRLAFAVFSQVDSRTILDQSGAERLLGRGDMLFLESGTTPVRLQGNFVSDDEIERITHMIKKQRKPSYYFSKEDLEQQVQSYDSGDDPLYVEALLFVAEQGQASASGLQRRFRVGYNRAARLIEMMEADGYVSGQNGGKARTVLITPEDAQAVAEGSTLL